MALLKVDLCPEVLTDELLDRLWNHFKIKTTVDFLDTDKDLISAELSIDPKIVSTIRQTIFDKHSLRAVNLGDVTTSGHLQERLPIPSLLTDLVSTIKSLEKALNLSQMAQSRLKVLYSLYFITLPIELDLFGIAL